jgi:ribosomal protein S12 methylthiotransferase
MELQTRLADARSQKLVGQTLDVIVDEWDEDEGAWAARTKADAPEIDGIVYIDGETKEGDFARVEITEAMGHVLRSRAIVR